MTPESPLSFHANRLLVRLPAQELERLAPRLHHVPLHSKASLCHFRAAIDYVYFPTCGIISAMTVMEDGRAIEVATIGNEGIAGLTALFGEQTSPYEMMVQVPGQAFRMSAAAFMQKPAANPPCGKR